MSYSNLSRPAAAALLSVLLLSVSVSAQAEERDDLEKLRATVLSLIDTLVKNHVIPKDKADAMMREAEQRANSRLSEMPPPETGSDGKKIVRVPYVPEAVKVQMRDQIKSEVLAETRSERGIVGADWLQRLQFEGDLRLRAESRRLDSGNTASNTAWDAMSSSGLTRFPDIWNSTAGLKSNGAIDTTLGGRNAYYSTQTSYNLTRLRARLGVNAKVSEQVSGGIFLTTGTTTGPTSTNQTMGQSFNKESVVIDRAYIKLVPDPWFNVIGGRFRNPYFSTDLVWNDNLNFEGFSMTVKPHLDFLPDTFFVAGWFPLNFSVPGQSNTRNLTAFQGGIDRSLGTRDSRLKLGAALYNYHGIEGVPQTLTSYNLGSPLPLYLSSAYGYGQRGNTLFRINAPLPVAANNNTGDSGTSWGLASSFRELNLTGALDLELTDSSHVVLTGDYVRNLGFSRSDIFRRTGVNLSDGQSTGYLGRIQVGANKISKQGDWNASVAYRYLGSDAVLDAFTDSDFGLGGTNSKGIILGMNYGLAKDTWISARWLSSNLIDSLIPTANTTTATKFAVDVLQIDLNTKF